MNSNQYLSYQSECSNYDQYKYNPACKTSDSCISTFAENVPRILSPSLYPIVYNNILKQDSSGYTVPNSNICGNTWREAATMNTYKDYENKIEDAYPTSKLKETNVLIRSVEMNRLAKKLFNRDLSPLLIDKSFLVGLPKTYFIIFEWDYLKDEGILYAERLKEAGVDVKIAFYEKAFHGNFFN